ncbi:MAG: lipopolysaccharide assembly protein LapA domain-containing protein [Alphaproteobacteria bacterium]
MRLLKNIIVLSILLIITGFCLINRQVITIHVIPKNIDIELPLFILIVINFVAGLIIGRLQTMTLKLKHMLETRKLKQSVENLNKEIASLKTKQIYEEDLKND